MNKADCLDAAKAAVTDRGVAYGKVSENFERIARRWAVHLLNRYGVIIDLDAVDVAQMMIDLKQARLENEPNHDDSWIDTAGYAACGADLFHKDA